MCAQVARALAVAHAAGIVHRDIKPENIMVREDGYVRVLDFGIARRTPQGPSSSSAATITGEHTAVDLVFGTARYMSPEQARGQIATGESDIFSMGVVLYEMATGRHPFAGDSDLTTLHAVRYDDPPAPSRLQPGLPPGLDDLILQMLSKDANRRPAASIVEQSLNALAETSAATGARTASVNAPVARGSASQRSTADSPRASTRRI